MASAAVLAPELPRRVIAFNCGDEKYAGEWLLDFRRTDGAWLVCVEALQAGLPTSCDEEYLQEFCAQTLAHLARSFRTRLPESALLPAREGLASLLAMHAEGPKSTWKQLALALTCSGLWLGTCAVTSVLEAGSLPVAVRNELLLLPTQLLFSDRALPLDDVRLRQAASMALFTAWQAVLPFLLQAPVFPSGEEGQSLSVIASWLRAVRKSLRLLTGCDEGAPLRILAEHSEELVAAAQLCPAEACEIAQQLALWPGCDIELAAVLSPLLSCLFGASFQEPKNRVMLPLLQDLAGSCWPRASLGNLGIDWQGISIQAVVAIHSALDDSHTDITEVEATFSVWQTLAETLCKGQADAEQTLGQSIDGIFEPRRKRIRRRDQAYASRDQIAQSEALPRLFSHLIQQLLERLRAPAQPSQEELVTLWEIRAAAQPAIAAWAMLLGEAHAQAKAAHMEAPMQRWSEVAWSPLHRMCRDLQQLRPENVADMTDETWSGVEVVLWFSATLVTHWPEQADKVPVERVLPEIGLIDVAPYPWKPLLWCSACTFATKAPAEHCQELLQWMLMRSPTTALRPFDHPVSDVLELTELQYAHNLEVVSRQLPRSNVHVAIGDRLAAMALGTISPSSGHTDSTKVKSVLLLALRHAMSNNAELLCQGLNQNILPLLCEAVAREVADASTQSDPTYTATQTLFSTLICALPDGLSTDLMHPALALWRQNWQYLESAMVWWPQSSATDQPAKAAVGALSEAVQALPMLLPDAIQLFSHSCKVAALPDIQLDGLREIVGMVPCPPVDLNRAAELLSIVINDISFDLLSRKMQDLLQSPTTLTSFFRLVSDAVSATGNSASGDADSTNSGLYEGKLREKLLATPDFVQMCLDLAGKALVERASDSVVIQILRFCVGTLASGRDGSTQPAAVRAALPELSQVICHALNQECLLDLEILEGAAEVLTLVTVGYGTDFTAALIHVLDVLQVPAFNRERLQRHVDACADWGYHSMEWLEQLQQIVREWQAERRHADG